MIPRRQRNEASAPLKYILKNKLIEPHHKVLDFGCGFGKDVKHLNDMGFDTTGYDPHVKGYENYIDKEYDVVLATYVFNTIACKNKHTSTLKELTQSNRNAKILITVRNDLRKENIEDWTYVPDDDVYITRTTKQRFYGRWTLEEAFPGFKVIKKTSNFIMLASD